MQLLLNLIHLSVMKSCLLVGWAETALTQWYLRCNRKKRPSATNPNCQLKLLLAQEVFTMLLAKEL